VTPDTRGKHSGGIDAVAQTPQPGPRDGNQTGCRRGELLNHVAGENAGRGGDRLVLEQVNQPSSHRVVIEATSHSESRDLEGRWGSKV
jgi:hypothetical protein